MIKINLLPRKTKKDSLTFDLYLFVLVALVNFAVLGSLYYINLKDIDKYRSMIENAKKEIASLDKVYKEYLNMEKEKKEIDKKIKAIESLKEGRALSARVLYDLTSLIKGNVWIKSFKKDEGRFEMEARSLENESISDLLENLSKISYVKSVELKAVEDISEGGVAVKKFIIQGTIG
jgi:Tfp pilus assembly protein PilN